jgi:murein DD-endopeptidase MepM/ murein hydrolase activator NlpD
VSRRLPLVLRRTLLVRLGSERAVPIAVAVLVLLASVVSLHPAVPAVGATEGSGTALRIAVGGAGGLMEIDGATAGSSAGAPIGAVDDGTVYKPVAVDTTVADGSDRLRLYTVQQGDTLTGVANRFGVSMMTIWWANSLTSKTALHVGQQLIIPPVSGLVVTVAEGDTLESLAAEYGISTQSIVEANGLEEPTLVIGQTLILPDAVGAPIPTAAPTQTPTPKATKPSGTTRVAGPVTYSGGRFAWPVVGGNNYISQYYHYSHPAIDIAGTYGSPVVAAGSGTVIFAGWKSNGGGWQVWISHGSGVYTTYNHMSAITISSGASVSRGQQVGRLGMSGWATGPHLHFEVWIGPIWNGGTRVNPMSYF